MRKHNLLGLFLLLLTAAYGISPAHAFSPIRFGIKGGIQTQSMKIQDLTWNDLSKSNNFGFQLGGMVQIPLGPIYLQPELVYSSARFKLSGELPKEFGSADACAKYSVNNIQMPVLVGMKLLFVRVFLGPSFTLMNDTSNKTDSGGVTVNATVTKPTVGFQVGAGVEIGKFNVDIRYDGQFKKPSMIFTQGTTYSTSMRTQMNSWQLNLGYFF